VCENVLNKDRLQFVLDFHNQPVPVAANIKNGASTHGISVRIIHPDISDALPTRLLRHAVPAI
jgi:hypothetical protein